MFLHRAVLAPTPSEYLAADHVGFFRGIDLLRGLAAITILVWHYQHFYMLRDTQFVDGAPAIDRTIQPFYVVLFPIYEHGFWAVSAFWTISGFVFAHVYAGKQTSAASFFTARFARLYPLHFITLVTIAMLQQISLSLIGNYQVVGANDAAGFAQQLLFISGWGLPHGGNFNGPIWSVSVEIAIYAAFFVLARNIYVFGCLLPAFIIAVCWCLIHADGPVWNFPLCGYFFFIGVTAYYWLLIFRNNWLAIIAPSAIGLAVFVYLIASGQYSRMRFYDVEVFLFAPVVLLLGWTEMVFKNFRRQLVSARWIGDTTYSTYLWHFPLQVAILIVVSCLGLDRGIFNNSTVLLLWVTGVVALAHLSFKYIERPAQNFIKAKFAEALAAHTTERLQPTSFLRRDSRPVSSSVLQSVP